MMNKVFRRLLDSRKAALQRELAAEEGRNGGL